MVFFNLFFYLEQRLRHNIADYEMVSSCTTTELNGNM